MPSQARKRNRIESSSLMVVMICPQDHFLITQMAYLSNMNPPGFANKSRSAN